MSVTILEALQNARYNIKTGKKFPPILDLAFGQLNNAIILLEKGYSIEDEVEPLLEKYDNIESVPDKPATVEILLEEFRKFEDDAIKLQALEEAGVDNWDGYPEAMKVYESYK